MQLSQLFIMFIIKLFFYSYYKKYSYFVNLFVLVHYLFLFSFN